MPIQTQPLTEQEFQIVFLNTLDSMTCDLSDRNYQAWAKAVTKLIINKSPQQQREMLNVIMERNRHLYQSYCQAVEKQIVN
ncbi:MAG: hypothetical protein AAFQ14_09800 [Cyanobacteria bacterium J06621_12]